MFGDVMMIVLRFSSASSSIASQRSPSSGSLFSFSVLLWILVPLFTRTLRVVVTIVVFAVPTTFSSFVISSSLSYSFISGIQVAGATNLKLTSHKGPRFLVEPPNRVDFLNSSGAIINCNAVGHPTPKITWIRGDAGGGHLASDIPLNRHMQSSDSLLHIRSDGSLYFSPFSEESFRQDIHSATYRCIASNVLGSIISRNVHVQAKGKNILILIHIPSNLS